MSKMSKYDKLYESLKEHDFNTTEVLKIVCAMCTRMAREQGKSGVEVDAEIGGQGWIYDIKIRGLEKNK